MRITIHYLAQIKRAIGVATETIELEADATLHSLVQELARRHGAVFDSALLFFVNDEHATKETRLADNDVVTILAPMAGGAAPAG